MSIFKQDPAAALAKTQDGLADVESNIVSLRAKRGEALLTAEDANAVVTIEKAGRALRQSFAASTVTFGQGSERRELFL
jgi:hypothetical protein